MKGADQDPFVFFLDSSSKKATDSEPPGEASRNVLTTESERIEPPEAPRDAPSAQQKSLPRRYAYRSRWVVWLFRLLDGLGAALFTRNRDRPKVFKRVIVLRPDHIGDVLFSLPALRALRKELPNARIDFLIGSWARSLLPQDSKDFHGIEVIEFSASWLGRPKKKRFGLMAVFRLACLLRRRERDLGGAYDLVVDLRGDFQSILAARLAGARFLAGRGYTGLGFFLDLELSEVKGRHQVECNLALIESLGFGPLETTNPKLELTGEEIEQGRALLRTYGVDGSKVVIGIHAGAGNPTKIWGGDKYADLIKWIITKTPSQVVIFGGPKDRSVTNDVVIALKGLRTEGRVVDLCGKLPGLRSFMMAACQCTVFVGNDSGPGHIAAALGVPVISVFSGTNDPTEWGPRGPSVVIVRKRVDCENCGLTFCDHHSCMVGLDPSTVYKALRRCV